MRVLCLVFVFLFGYVNGKTDKEIRKEFVRDVMACSAKDSSIDMYDLLQVDKLKVPTKYNVKCCLACVYKKMGTLNEEGKYDIEEGYKFAETAMKGDDKRIENAKKLADICSKINEASVSDGSNGCDRAAFLFKCVVENAPKLGFKI